MFMLSPQCPLHLGVWPRSLSEGMGPRLGRGAASSLPKDREGGEKDCQPPAHGTTDPDGERLTQRPKCCWRRACSWGERPGEPPSRPWLARLGEGQMRNEVGWQGVAAGLTPVCSRCWLLPC